MNEVDIDGSYEKAHEETYVKQLVKIGKPLESPPLTKTKILIRENMKNDKKLMEDSRSLKLRISRHV